MTPLVSVIIPTYQRAHTLARAIRGALEQTYRPLEVIVSDNASMDGTEALLARFAGHPELRTLRHSENLGPVANWRAALDAAGGDLIKVNWSDDWMDPNVVADLVKVYRAEPRVAFTVSNPTIHLSQGTAEYSVAPGIISMQDVVGSVTLGLGLPVSPGAALIERQDAEWALEEACTRMPGACVEGAIGPDLLMVYGALRRGRLGAHTGRAGVHFDGGSDSITMTADRDRLRACYLVALQVLLDDLGDAAHLASLQQLLRLQSLTRRLRGRPTLNVPANGEFPFLAQAQGSSIVVRQLRKRVRIRRRIGWEPAIWNSLNA